MSLVMNRTSIENKNKFWYILFLSGCLISPRSFAVEFNINFIDSAERTNVDLSRFQVASYIAPGEYLLDVVLNGHNFGEQHVIRYISIDDNKNSRICLPPSLVDRIGLTNEVREKLLLWEHGECVSLDQQKEIIVLYDQKQQTLNISVPQAWLAFRDPNWVPPSQWEDGVSGVLLDYNLLGSKYMPKKADSSTSFSSYGTTGLNLGPWRARADYQYSSSRISGTRSDKLTWTQSYLYRALPSLSARLAVGQTYLGSDIFDSFRFLGVSLNSDQRMLPPALRGYAPQVTGIAKTNAKVSISQNGRIIYQTNVSPGPFVIQDLTEAVQGSLDVKIEEENGSTTTYQVTTATIPFLTRKGQIRFKTAMGKPTTGIGNHVLQPGFYSGELSWGALNNFSVYGGLITTTGNYQAQAFGLGQNLQEFGAVSFDTTHSSAEVPLMGKQAGLSYRANYSKRFDSTGSQITFAGYRFSERSFMSFNQYLDKINGNGYSRDDKQTYTVSVNQYLPWPAITLYLSATHKIYWNDSPSNNYSLSVSKIFDIGRFTDISATFSASKLNYRDTDEKQIFLSLSLPLSSGQQISYDAQQDSQSGFSQMASYYNSQDPNNSWRVAAGGGSPEIQKGNGVFRANYQHMSPYGQFWANGSMKNNDYHSVSASWYGSFTATAAGAALHQNSAGSEPRVMVSTDVKGIPFNSGLSVTNDYGITVVNGVSSYQTSDIRVDVNNLPDDVEIYSSVVSKTLTEGAIGFRKIRAIKGERLMAVVRLADGSHPPLGASVTDDSSGFEAGLIGDGGLAYLAGVSGEKHLTVHWGAGKKCHVQVPSQADTRSGQILLPCY